MEKRNRLKEVVQKRGRLEQNKDLSLISQPYLLVKGSSKVHNLPLDVVQDLYMLMTGSSRRSKSTPPLPALASVNKASNSTETAKKHPGASGTELTKSRGCS